MSKAKVALVVGSQSDLPRILPAKEVLEEAGAEVSVDIVSAHRSPQLAPIYLANAEAAGVDAIIAGAGLAAQLPGLLAPITHIPVIGLPLTSSRTFMNGLDALLSISHMPPGVPLVSGGIDSAKNVALVVLRFLRHKDGIQDYLEKVRQGQYQEAVINENQKLAEGKNEAMGTGFDKLLKEEEILANQF
ncbi:MAG: AIR carboxylase family protein [Candidatus Melainabacteria bacterium]|nr:AIR carboxylase family protein [Candidatus Melainabacteria bacterium]